MILHIIHRAEWAEACCHGAYRPTSLDAEGFIHCSTISQAVATANIFFHGATDLLILIIDERKLAAPLKLETPAVSADARPTDAFPHIYGPLNLDAVIDVLDFPCAPDGCFRLPTRLGGFL